MSETELLQRLLDMKLSVSGEEADVLELVESSRDFFYLVGIQSTRLSCRLSRYLLGSTDSFLTATLRGSSITRSCGNSLSDMDIAI